MLTIQDCQCQARPITVAELSLHTSTLDHDSCRPEELCLTFANDLCLEVELGLTRTLLTATELYNALLA